MKTKFYICDVFGDLRYSGNQLATFLDFGKISTEEMQQIAREINFSETTFITGKISNDNGYPVRIFTPESEIGFAGHPSLGTAFIIRNYLEKSGQDLINLDYSIGRIPVKIEGDVYWMKQKQPLFGDVISSSTIARVLGIDESEIEKDFPVLEVTTGLPFTIVPLKSIDSLRRARVDPNEYDNFIQSSWAKGILVFSKEAYEKKQDLSVRVFVNYLGIPEDPATGSAAGCLAAYFLKTNYFELNQLSLNIGQGYEINRPSNIKINASKLADDYEINIGGNVNLIASGDWQTGI